MSWEKRHHEATIAANETDRARIAELIRPHVGVGGMEATALKLLGEIALALRDIEVTLEFMRAEMHDD